MHTFICVCVLSQFALVCACMCTCTELVLCAFFCVCVPVLTKFCVLYCVYIYMHVSKCIQKIKYLRLFQVHYPSDPLQPGPIYFLTPRKCAVFGVHCEAIPRQVNFLCDEAGSCGKGANTVISQLHFFFQCHGLGENKI